MGGCFGFNATLFALKRVGDFFQWWGLEPKLVSLDHETVIHCWIPAQKMRKSAQGSEKPALVLLHAFGSFGLSWAMQVPQFSKKYRLYIPDLVFFGKSISKTRERSEFFQAHCVMKMLRKLNVNTFSVIGTSYGGFVAYRLAHLYPHAVDKVVLSSSGVCMTPSSDERLVKECGVASIKDILVPKDAEGVRRILNLAFHRMPFPILDYFCEEYLQEVLIIWGDKDKIFLPDLAFQLKEYIGASAQIAIIKGAAHTPQVEKFSLYNQIVMSFLNSAK